ncbi:hypothetical protein Q9L58_010448 [Maublancomyces gigas]|uniref:Uncharacterized protein n=1 Tax=Discina gigas TaxID=1032678 RepID=A0ABR3G448_9PEZI
MSDFSQLPHAIEDVAPEWALLLLSLFFTALCTFLGWKVFARAKTDEPTGGIPPTRHEVREKDKVGEVDVEPVGEKLLLDGGDGRNGLEESVVTTLRAKGKRTTRRG